MAKKVVKLIKLQIQAGKANPAPPIGPALGAAGCNIMEFCKQFNAQTQDKIGDVIPVEITVFQDRTFTFILKSPPVSRLILKYTSVAKGSKIPNRDKVGQLTVEQAEEIARIKLSDMGVRSLESAIRMVVGTAKSMGIDVVGIGS